MEPQGAQGDRLTLPGNGMRGTQSYDGQAMGIFWTPRQQFGRIDVSWCTPSSTCKHLNIFDSATNIAGAKVEILHESIN